jgi:hypothetical protein
LAAKKEEKKVVRLVYRDPRYAGPGLPTGDDEWTEEIGPHSNDDGTLKTAHGAVIAYTAAWIVYLTTPDYPGLWCPPVTVEACGLPYDRRTKRYSRLWQVEGTALVEAARLTQVVGDLAETQVTDYRDMSAGRMRRSSETSNRARAWCEEYERRQRETGDYDHPPVMPLPHATTPAPGAVFRAAITTAADDKLTYYRSLVSAGHIEEGS